MDGIVCIHHNADRIFKCLHQPFLLKPKYDALDMYLSAKLCKIRLNNGVLAWAMSPLKYDYEVMRNCKAHLVANYSGRYILPKEQKILCDGIIAKV